MALRPDQKYLLGDFLLDPAKRRLERGGEPVHLANKPFQVLLYLIEHRDRVVTRSELLDEFWEGSDVYDESLRKSVGAIRKALGDAGNGNPRYIETRWAEGYRYVGPLKEVSTLAGFDQPSERGTTSPHSADVAEPTQEAASARREDEEDDRLAEQESSEEKGDDETDAQTPPANAPTRWPLRVPASNRLAIALALVALTASSVGTLTMYRLSKRAAGAHAQAVQLSGVRSVAVLPLKNLSPEPENEYLSDGITDSLISVLSRVEGLRVVSRGTAFTFKGRDVDPREVGRQLGVDAVLEGSVARGGDELRVEARLVSARDGSVLLPTVTFERPARDLLALQDEIARGVATGLGLTGEGPTRLAAHPTENAEAYEAYIKGRYFLNKRTPEGITKAIGYFQQAIAKDPNYALAYAALAESYDKSYWFTRLRLREVLAKEKEAAARALALDDMSAEAHVAMATVYANEWRLADAAREEERAIEINPSNAEARHNYAYRLIDLLRPDEAVAEIRRARELDPLNEVMNVDVGQVLTFVRRYDEAIGALCEAVEMERGSANAHWNLAAAYELKGMYAEAVTEYAEALTLLGEGRQAAELKKAYESGGIKGFWRKRLEQLTARPGHDESTEIAILHANLGDKDQAFAWLEKSYQRLSPTLVGLKSSPWFDALRSDPRYADLVRRVGLPR